MKKVGYYKTYQMTIGESMRRAREKAEITAVELSKRSGVDAWSIGQFELDRHLPRIDRLELLADALGISIDEYIGHEVKVRNKQ